MCYSVRELSDRARLLRTSILEPSTNPEVPRKALFLGLIGLSIVVVLMIVVSFRKTNRPKPVPAFMPPAAPELPVETTAPAAEPPPPEPTAPTSLVPPIPSAGVDSSAAEVNQLILLSRRIETTDPDRSRQLLRQVLELDPQNEAALERLSKKMLLDEQHAAARELLERCLSVHPGSVECTAARAQLPDPQAMETAVKSAQECVNRTPEDTSCLFTLTDNALVQSQKDAASLVALRMHSLAPDSPLTKLVLGRIDAMNGKYREARPLLEAGCRLGNEQACFRANLLRLEGW
jgi:hypothetical protein